MLWIVDVDAFRRELDNHWPFTKDEQSKHGIADMAKSTLLAVLNNNAVPVVRCKDCKHWTQSMGKMKGYGLGRCDFHDADLVTCNGYCYWAERRTDE